MFENPSSVTYNNTLLARASGSLHEMQLAQACEQACRLKAARLVSFLVLPGCLVPAGRCAARGSRWKGAPQAEERVARLPRKAATVMWAARSAYVL